VVHDRILERTLSQVRAEKARGRRRRAGVVAAVGATLAAAVLAGGVYLGRHSVPGERVLVATAAGVRMTATVTPADGWLRLRAVVDGVDAGEKCRLVVTDRRGRRYVAGGWVASRSGDSTQADSTQADSTQADTALAGAAMVDPDDLATIDVVTVDGRVLVRAVASE
jgi:hypothetical protein